MTPCTRVIVMDKWVKDYIKFWDNSRIDKFENILISQQKEKNEIVNEFNLISGFTLQTVKENILLIKGLLSKYLVNIVTPLEDVERMIMKLIFSLLNRDEKIFSIKNTSSLLLNKNFVKSVIVVGLEITLFIENVDIICFYKLANVLELELYEFWKIINPFIRVDLTIPSDIRLHFEEIEIGLWSYMIFKKPSDNFKREVTNFQKKEILNFEFNHLEMLKKMQDLEFNNQSLFVYMDKSIFTETTSNLNKEQLSIYSHLSPIYILFRRIMNYAIFLNKKITEALKLTTETAKECEILLKKIFTTSESFDVLYDKHIDQILICCIIANMKQQKVFENNSLNLILSVYKELRSGASEITPLDRIDKNGNNILQLYENSFIKKVAHLINRNEEEEYRIARKRKFSLQENEIRKASNPYDEESAFDSSTLMYEPLSKIIFPDGKRNNISSTGHLLITKSNFMAYSTSSSPLVSRSVNNASRTPRSIKLRDAYWDFISDNLSSEKSNESSLNFLQRQNSSHNKFKDKLKSQVSSNKIIIDDFGGFSKDTLQFGVDEKDASREKNSGTFRSLVFDDAENSNIFRDISKKDHDGRADEINQLLGSEPNTSLMRTNSKTTPDFNKVKK